MYEFASPAQRMSPPTKNSSKYDMRLNPVYQVDYHSSAAGKHISTTKRRVCFRFGFSNADSIREGLTGVDCRGEEHEVNLVWSLTSGKRLVLLDGDEVHFSKGNRTETLFETTFPIGNCHLIKLIAHAAPPLFMTPGFRQFDMLLDGCSIFDMPKIFELGKSPSRHTGGRRMQSTLTRVVSTPPQQVQRLEQSHAPESRIAPISPKTDLLQNTPSKQDYLDSPSTASTAPSTYSDEFTPVAVQPTVPTFDAVANQILSSYSVASTPTTDLYLTSGEQQQPVPLTPVQAFLQEGRQWSPVVHESLPVDTPAIENSPSAAQKLTMDHLSIAELDARDQPENISDYERSLRALVNFDDITETKETPEQSKTNKAKEIAQSKGRSKPMAPISTDWHVGGNASLAEIRNHAQPKASPQKEIMRTHAFDPAAAQAGMMVVYGAGAGYSPAQYQGSYAPFHQQRYVHY